MALSLSLGAAGGADDLAIAKFQADAVEVRALVDGRRVERDVALHRILHRTREDLAVGDVVRAAADDGGDALDAETQIGAGTFDLDAVGAFEAFLERGHAGLHLGVIQRADAEEEILECLGAHPGLLGHGGGRPAQHAPARVANPMVEHGLENFHGQSHALAGYVAHLGDVVAAAHGDVGVHALHPGQFDFLGQFVLRFRGAEEHLAGDAALVNLHEGKSALGTNGTDEGDGHFGRNVEGVEENFFAGFEASRKAG